jgi:hypothetical protein
MAYWTLEGRTPYVVSTIPHSWVGLTYKRPSTNMPAPTFVKFQSLLPSSSSLGAKIVKGCKNENNFRNTRRTLPVNLFLRLEWVASVPDILLNVLSFCSRADVSDGSPRCRGVDSHSLSRASCRRAAALARSAFLLKIWRDSDESDSGNTKRIKQIKTA